MHFHLPHRNETRLVPRSIQEYLESRFHLSIEYVKTLRCFTYEGTVGTKEVKRVSIFRPEEAIENNIVIKTRKDLDENPSMILFEGYIDKHGKPYAADRRKPVKVAKKKKTPNNKEERE